MSSIFPIYCFLPQGLFASGRPVNVPLQYTGGQRIPKKCSVLKYQRLLWKWNCNLFSELLYNDFVLHLVKKVLLSVIEPTNYIQRYTVNMWEDTRSEYRFKKRI